MGSFFLDHVTQLTETVDRVPLAAYDATTDYIMDVRGMDTKTLLIKNTGPTGASGINYTILASIEAPVRNSAPAAAASWDERARARMALTNEFDITHASEAPLAQGAQALVTFHDPYTLVKVRVKSAGATTVTIKSVASSN